MTDQKEKAEPRVFTIIEKWHDYYSNSPEHRVEGNVRKGEGKIQVIEFSAWQYARDQWDYFVEETIKARNSLAAEQLKVKKLRDALERMHNVVVGKNYAQHISLTSNPIQNGCYVDTEWALRDIKHRALAETEDKT